MIKSITYKPLFWLLFCITAGISIVFSFKYFPKTFDIVHLDIKINRQEALAIAQNLHTKFGWLPKQDYQQAAGFGVNKLAKTYIELEAGGYSAFSKILEDSFYSPYTWKIRQFHEFDIHESHICLTPAGKPYSFEIIIPEDLPGAALSKEQAQEIALKTIKEWLIDINAFTLVEESQETMTTGRIDHTFTYEGLEKVGQAPYRLTIVVKGDQASKLKLALKVPEAFERRYATMRSYNNTLALIATVLMVIFYFFGGTLFGFIYLYRRKAVAWKMAFFWAFLIAGLQFLGNLNDLPMAWMGYPTSLSRYIFLSKLLISYFYVFCFYLAIGYPIILVAEGLTRLAFGNHLQLWKVWSHQGAHSLQVLGRTIAAYLMVAIDMAYVIIFYFFALKYLGWWSPAEALYEPNILASYFPWLTPIEKSLAAGFLEECFFRAIPLAGAALIGQYFGKRKAFVIIAYIIQALIFGAAHANYPAQPFFARMIELIIPSFIFGFTYLKFGLLSAIITHFIFDVVWFAMPIFVSSDLYGTKFLVVALSAIPLCITLLARLKNTGWIQLPTQLYNRAWQAEPNTSTPDLLQGSLPTTKNKAISNRILSALTLGAVALWLLTTPFKAPVPALTVTRNQAIALANQQFAPQLANQSWNVLAGFRDPLTMPVAHGNKEELTFAWRHIHDAQNRNAIFYQLLDSYLLPPHWQVRFTKMSDTIADRAEELRARIGTNGKILQLEHVLPQDTAAPLVTKEEAQQLVDKEYLAHFEEHFDLVCALEQKMPNRKDWRFTLSTLSPELSQGQKRILATVAGQEITNAYPFIFVPEKWHREFNQEETLRSILKLVQLFLLVFCLMLAFGFFFRLSGSLKFSIKAALVLALILILCALLQTLNIWQQYASMFITQQPYTHQAFGIVSGTIMKTLLDITLYSSLIGIIYGAHWYYPTLYNTSRSRLLLGVLLGTSTAIVHQLVGYWLGSCLQPLWPDLITAGGTITALSESLHGLTTFIRITLMLSALVTMFDTISYFHFHKLCLLLITLLAFGITPITTTSHWILLSIFSALCGAVLYRYIIPYAQTTIPLAVATFVGLQALQQGIFAPYPGAFLGGVIGCAAVAISGWYWSKNLAKL